VVCPAPAESAQLKMTAQLEMTSTASLELNLRITPMYTTDAAPPSQA
jgi:hypothetical protein